MGTGQYFAEEFPKKQIYLHHTVGGTAKSTFDWWNGTPDRVGTAFIIDRDGTIYQVFDPKYWAFHLGLTTSNNLITNKSSIGIEIANWGALRNGHQLNADLSANGAPERFDEDYVYALDIDRQPKKPPSEWFLGAKKLYHMFHDRDKFFDCVVDFRDYSYFDNYTPAQVVAANELVLVLCEQFGVPKVLLPHDDRFTFNPQTTTFNGVLTHCNVRLDKTDLSPAWDWSLTAKALGLNE